MGFVGDRRLVINRDQQVDIVVGGVVLVLSPLSVAIAKRLAWSRNGMAAGDWERGSGLAGSVDILSHTAVSTAVILAACNPKYLCDVVSFSIGPRN